VFDVVTKYIDGICGGWVLADDERGTFGDYPPAV
jgi:hypothetical protein